MGNQTIIERVKEWLAGICWGLFLWLNNLTENEYFRQIKEQELRTGESRPLEKLVMPKIAEDMLVKFYSLLNVIKCSAEGINSTPGSNMQQVCKVIMRSLQYMDAEKAVNDYRDASNFSA